MNFHDDSHILSRLGILQSKDESPNKVHYPPSKKDSKAASEKDRFVEVSISGEVSSETDSDEEPLFDKNSLLSMNRNTKVYRRRPNSYSCAYVALLLSYFAVGALWITSVVRQRHSNTWFPSLMVLYGFATLFGTIIGGLACWFVHWRGYNRKFLLLYVLIASGSSFALLAFHNPIQNLNTNNLNVIASSITVHKRETTLDLAFNNDTLSNSTSAEDTTPPVKPRKPQVAEGSQVVETKSEQNEQMRKAIAANKTKCNYYNHFTVYYYCYCQYANYYLHFAAHYYDNVGLISPVIVPNKHDAVSGRIGSVLTTVALVFYLLAFLSCCLPCAVRSDGKFTKSVPNNTIALSAFRCFRRWINERLPYTAGIGTGLVEIAAVSMSVELKSESMPSGATYYVVVALTRFVIMICGPCAFSPSGCCVSLLCSLLGSLLVLNTASYAVVGFVLLAIGAGTLSLLVFLYVEVRVSPKAGAQLDYFIFPSTVGRFLAALLCSGLKAAHVQEIIAVVVFMAASLVPLLSLLVRSVGKAARLKEIMEYSSSPVPRASGEYVSLMERGVGFESGDDDGSEREI
ncbi:unnamed protein product [Nippostrongylus brasiliensis]|uniref:UNC93-like protein n=1 Tax=Nippostrongylus brasiliensis TaxID=27835 RepID=A0A0N4XDJ8_NIPBR|nr:unnamed protein product [Nippostrongylus brasiliensis]